jgi:hypothetical protein
VNLDDLFDVGTCLYDVVGSYADDHDNYQILENMTRHSKPNGYVLLSVMNMELTERKAKHWFSIDSEPDKLLTLRASDTMEKRGSVFNPDFYLIDRKTRIVYRKEQFAQGEELPEELLVRDVRFSKEKVEKLCTHVGLEVLWTRFVGAGAWRQPLPRLEDHAKKSSFCVRNPWLKKGCYFRKSEVGD